MTVSLSQHTVVKIIWLIVGILFFVNGVRGKPSAGQPEFPPAEEEIANAQPPGKVARVISVVAGIAIVAYSIYVLLR